MKNAARHLFVTSLTGALALVSSCSSGGEGGGAMFVQSCTLGCTNGSDGSQVGCGIINTYQNQDVAVVFSEPIDPTSLLFNNSFQIVDTVTGSVPPGSRKLDPNNPRRALFRPKLTIDANGNPSFGFSSTSSYQIRIPGTAQSDVGPFVESAGGQSNRSRLLCTITTNLGLVDPVPGKPTVSVFVDALDANDINRTVNVDTLQVVDPATGIATPTQPVLKTAQVGALTVLKDVRRGYDPFPDPDMDNDPDLNPIVITFNDLMNIGTLVLPASGVSPFITVTVDADGNPNTNDGVPWGGTYTYSVDQDRLTTTLKFFPSAGYPSAGVNPNAPRLVVVDIPTAVKDLAGNSVVNIGRRIFIPEVIGGSGQLLPAGGEQFEDTANMDPKRSGGVWGATDAQITGKFLAAGRGGGSGRLGDLVLADGQTRVVFTEPQKSVGRIKFLRNPKIADNGAIMFGLLGDPNAVPPTVTTTTAYHELKKANPPAQPTHVRFEDHVTDTMSEFVRYFRVNALADPLIAMLDFHVEGADTIVVTAKNPGFDADNFFFAGFPVDLVTIEGGTSVGTVDPNDINWLPTSVSYNRGFFSGGTESSLGAPALSNSLLNALDRRNFITNIDFPAPQIPIATAIPDFDITGGQFEFAYVRLNSNSTLIASGTEPLRMFSRGRIQIADTGLIDVSGADAGLHPSDAPLGQVGGRPGPGGGRGGQGGDRPDNTGSTLLNLTNCTAASCGGSANNPLINKGMTNPNLPELPIQIDGRVGEGVGGVLGFGGVTGLGVGQAGAHWPPTMPTETNVLNDLDSQQTNCESQQLGGAGSGGAYATDGGIGTAVSSALLGVRGTSNTPADTLGGDSSTVGLEAAGSPGVRRKLTPSAGYLRGGSGGGGGGAGLFGTRTNGGANCFAVGAAITQFRSHSGASGGGGGGAIQLVAGDLAEIDGRIDASGGNGGGVLPQPLAPYGIHAAPGGGGSGGAILLQARTVDLSPLANRLLVGGGAGGIGQVFVAGTSSGGSGGAGLVRIEADAGINQASAAISVSPSGGPNNSEDWLSVDVWSNQTATGESMSGSQSCWLNATEPGFFSLLADEDEGPLPTDDKGWDMDILLDLDLNPGTPPSRVSYRTGVVFSGQTPEQRWGNLIDDGTVPSIGAPVVVRFQGAKAVGLLNAAELCDLDVSDTQKVVFGSLTPWVMHPEQLNRALTKPDMMRYQIIFDRSHPDFAMIKGVTNFRIHVTPD